LRQKIIFFDLCRQDVQSLIANEDFGHKMFAAALSGGQVLQNVGAIFRFVRILQQSYIKDSISIDFGSNDSGSDFLGSTKLARNGQNGEVRRHQNIVLTATYFFQTIDSDRINGNSILVALNFRGHKIDFVQMGLDWLLGLCKSRRSGDLILKFGRLTRKNSGSVLCMGRQRIGSKDYGSGTKHLLQDLSSFYRICSSSRLLVGVPGRAVATSPRKARRKQQKENEECIALGHHRNICSELVMRAMYDSNGELLSHCRGRHET
jgi:hypothetical protein